MKKCPQCGEFVRDEAISCRFCSRPIDKKRPVPWFFSKAFITLVLMIAGPLALPLIIFHPAMNKFQKFLFSVVVMAITFYYMLVLSGVQTAIEALW